MTKLGFTCIGGDNAPYLWVNTGAGFGKCGEGHVRISAFNSRENVEKALVRIATALGK